MMRSIQVLFFAGFLCFTACAELRRENRVPYGLLCELMAFPERTGITDPNPEFSWVVPLFRNGDRQTACRILVASDASILEQDEGDLWDSGRMDTPLSVNVPYGGKPLPRGSDCYWKVMTWNREGKPSPYSRAQQFRFTGTESPDTPRYPLESHPVYPVKKIRTAKDHYFLDFGKAAFGTLELSYRPVRKSHTLNLRLGEKQKDRAVDENPGASIRYLEIPVTLELGTRSFKVPIPINERNTRPAAIRMPAETGEVLPFRFCEITGWTEDLGPLDVRRIDVHYPFNDQASYFTCSDPVLNDVWDLCKYSIKATSFCGVYVDGDRERIPYEADAYINQLGHYSVDREFTLARYTYEYLITHPTWPTEWILQSVLLAWTDLLHTGNMESAAGFYEDLKSKTLSALAREDGLISTTGGVSEEVLSSIHFQGELRDIVDWPPASFTDGGQGERDGYVMTDINTVVNAFHYHALVLMSRIAGELGNAKDEKYFLERSESVETSINGKLLDRERGIYVDGEGTDHASLHANFFPLAFGLVPDEYKKSVVDWIKSRGMACSVYGAQFLLEALFQEGEDDYALMLMTNRTDRSWPHMIYDIGSTITLEAWDVKYKKNLDWNHAWGAAPANIIPRFLLGIKPLEPGFAKVEIRPQTASLEYGKIVLPTLRGEVRVAFRNNSRVYRMEIAIPANMEARVMMPRGTNTDFRIVLDGEDVEGKMEGGFVMLDRVGSGRHTLKRVLAAGE